MGRQRLQNQAVTKMKELLVVVEAPPLGVQFVPVGSISLSTTHGVKINPRWEDEIKARVASGRVTGREPF